ncbi:CvpA family protein [Verrucomicrobiaceae bacterium R5-34]|uniref:CvpA family protein n=1 Tax=Oceaniferula flava TaxID=2800421 RepID=A0AAE2S9T1_9BACT|nr:CvpA family protein [Oceaniferula flavus]MBK1830296.1 CvpA family protein [Verrucomicrobiaceae bacterium R5-34]MBK1854388.1 CvpA family protein [Oceaniferula flavus]MBM1135694.1 CvpA family protein [Oceaniferula flavus]
MNIPDLGATGIIGVIIVAFFVIGFLKGLIRTVLALICLAIGGYTALWGHEHASELTGPWISNPGPWLPKIIAVITGLVVFFICRFLLKFLVDPFDRSKTGERFGFGLPAALMSLCAGLIVLWAAFTGVRYAGSLAEIRHTRHLVLANHGSDAESVTEPLLMQAKHSLDSSSVGQWQRTTDPFDHPDRIALCKLLIMYHHPQIRQKMLLDRELNELLNDPIFIAAAYDQDVATHSQSGRPRELYHDVAVITALTHSSFATKLQMLDHLGLQELLP